MFLGYPKNRQYHPFRRQMPPCRTGIYCGIPCIKPAIFVAIFFFIRITPRISGLVIQLLGHPSLRTDLYRLIRSPIAGISQNAIPILDITASPSPLPVSHRLSVSFFPPLFPRTPEPFPSTESFPYLHPYKALFAVLYRFSIQSSRSPFLGALFLSNMRFPHTKHFVSRRMIF